MNITPLGVAKFVASGIVGLGTTKIVGKIIKNHVSPETLIEKVTVTAAAFIIGSMAAERTKDYTGEMIDDVVNTVNKVVDKVKLEQKLGRINAEGSTFEEEGLDPRNFCRNPKNGKWVPIEEETAGKS